jgi:hypothetical protein
MELMQLIDCPEFAKAWNHLCDTWGRATPGPGHTKMRITAYAANVAHDPALEQKAQRLLEESLTVNGQERWPATLPVIQGAPVPRPVQEVAVIATPDVSQWAIDLITTTELLRRYRAANLK